MIRSHCEDHIWDTNRRCLERLAQEGIFISIPTLRKARALLGYRRTVAATKPFLNALKKEKRLQYAQKSLETQQEWRSVIFTDECNLYVDQLYRAHVTRPSNSNRLDDKFIQYAFR